MTIPHLAQVGLAGALVAGAVAGFGSTSAQARDDGFSVVGVELARPFTTFTVWVLFPPTWTIEPVQFADWNSVKVTVPAGGLPPAVEPVVNSSWTVIGP